MRKLIIAVGGNDPRRRCLVVCLMLFVICFGLFQQFYILPCLAQHNNNYNRLNQVMNPLASTTSDSSSPSHRSLLLEADIALPDLLPVVTAQEALDFPIMLPVADSCQAGLSYTITSMNDLESVLSNGQIWCLFSVGLVPEKLPLGGLLVTFLTFHTTRFWVPWGFNFLQAKQGKFIIETHCPSETHHLVGAGVGGDFPVWGVATLYRGEEQVPPTSATRTVSSLPNDHYVEDEYNDGRGGIILDFRQHTSLVCPYQPNANLPPVQPPPQFKPFDTKEILINSIIPGSFPILPVTQHIDVARIVGRDVVHGDFIYLVRSGVQDNNRPDRGIETYMWSAWRGNDTSVISNFISGDSIGPTKAFQYKQPGVFLNYYKRVLPGVPGF
eukprot:GHVS01084050.1.p1 GENE.GHVS01084050.1~~GHVS01084050.1.p1  ORF type:complete len:384 (+),score=38.37 GHVS01084050.1:261-1412(+)